MQDSAITNVAPTVPVALKNGQSMPETITPLFPSERLQELAAALEMPFDAGDIKWRVTNTTKVGGRNGPVLRGQVLAYADPRAYTDRLNELFGPPGWTRDYNVQTVQNFERKERGATERTITAKIVVTCKVTIYRFGTHTGLGEEWADNENAGTAAEAQAFKRACSCFGLGRYLYDLDGQWVDLDDHKRPLQTPKLPEWARPSVRLNGQNGQHSANGHAKAASNGATGDGKGGLYREDLLSQVRVLCEKVGFSLSRSVLRAVTNFDDPVKIRDMAKLTAAFEKLEDTARGVGRLRRAVALAGDGRYPALCRELNLSSESIDDIPDRTVLRRLVEALEAEGSGGTDRQGEDNPGMDNGAVFSELRGRLLRAAARVSGATKRTLAEVIHEAGKGALSLSTLKSVGEADISKLRAALAVLERTGVRK